MKKLLILVILTTLSRGWTTSLEIYDERGVYRGVIMEREESEGEYDVLDQYGFYRGSFIRE